MTDGPTPDQLKMTRRMAHGPDGSRGLSQTDLARTLGVSVGTVSAWETGKRPMPAWQYSFLLWTLGHR